MSGSASCCITPGDVGERPIRSRRSPRIIFRLAASLLAPFLIVACASAPPRGRPDLEVDVPEQWTGSMETDADRKEALGGEAAAAEAAVAPVPEDPASTVEWPDADWWTAFDDERLNDLVDEVLANNRDLSAAAARVEAAAAQARIAGADLLPQAGFEYTPGRRRQNFIGFPITGSGNQVPHSTVTTHGASINVSWEIDLWGRLRAGAAAALAGVEASQADFAGARLSLAGQTAKAWYALIEAGQQVTLARETNENRRLTTRRVRRRYELGLRPALDLRLAMTNEAASEATLALRERALDSAKRQIELLLSRYPDGILAQWDSSLVLPTPPPATPSGIPSELMTRRPDLVAAERRLAATGLGIKEARAALYPRLQLFGSAGRLSDDIGNLLDTDFSVWSLAASLLQPIFQGGKLRAGVDLAEANYREVAESYVQTVLDAFSEVELALVAERYLADQEAALEEAAVQSLAARALAEDRYNAGLSDYLSVLQAQRDSTLAQSGLLSVRRQLLAARIDFYLALGGGFVAPPVGDDGASEDGQREERVEQVALGTVDR